jgi:hypothetical protein
VKKICKVHKSLKQQKTPHFIFPSG